MADVQLVKLGFNHWAVRQAITACKQQKGRLAVTLHIDPIWRHPPLPLQFLRRLPLLSSWSKAAPGKKPPPGDITIKDHEEVPFTEEDAIGALGRGPAGIPVEDELG